MDFCNCPVGNLTAINIDDCPFDIGQIQKLVFVKKNAVIWDSIDGATNGNGVPSENSSIDTLADWVARFAANDKTKVVITPFIGGEPIIESGEAITEGGGDNSTLNGAEIVTGINPSVFSAVFKSISPKTRADLAKLACHDLEVYYISENNVIYAQEAGLKGETPKMTYKGFDIQGLFVSDRGTQGFGTKDTVNIRFSMPSGWDKGMVAVKPTSWRPLYDLKEA